jgi:hypothetical protein
MAVTGGTAAAALLTHWDGRNEDDMQRQIAAPTGSRRESSAQETLAESRNPGGIVATHHLHGDGRARTRRQ